jgi:hypothetical protein
MQVLNAARLCDQLLHAHSSCHHISKVTSLPLRN